MPENAARIGHAFSDLRSLDGNGLTVLTRRHMLAAGLSGMAGLGANVLHASPTTGIDVSRPTGRKAVILLWMAGGPSQLDTWDPKPERPAENRGPFASIPTAVPGTDISEHLPKQAAMMDRFTVIRSVDSKRSEHSPNKVMQTGNTNPSPRHNAKGDMYPAIGSVVARFHGANQPGMPPYVAFNRDPAHIARGGMIGMRYDPMNGHRAAGLPEYKGFGRLTEQATDVYNSGRFELTDGLTADRVRHRGDLIRNLNRLPAGIDQAGAMDAADYFQDQAIQMVLGGAAQSAFDLSRETPVTVTANTCGVNRHYWPVV